MKLIRNILLAILVIQFLIFLFVKLMYEPTLQEQIAAETLIETSINEIREGAKELPQSTEYTVWDKQMIDNLNQEIEDFNNEIRKIIVQTQHLNLQTKEAKQETKAKTEENISDTKVVIAQKNSLTEEKAEKSIKKEKFIPTISLTQKVAKYAKEKLGQKYVWGATGPKTFDCSGFTKNVFKCTTGIKIPRVSRDQAKVGTYVAFEELRRGDMVFFDTEKKYTGKVNHVGIYLSNHNFIHASSARKKVIITNFKKKPFYKKRFLWGRRIIKNAS